MASLYKKPVVITDPKTGERVKSKSKKWWGRYRDALGRDRRVPLAADKAAAQAKLNSLVIKVEREAAGISDAFDDHAKRPLSEHLKEFGMYLRNKDNTDDYVQRTVARVESAFKECKFVGIRDISASRLQAYIGELRKKGIGITTCNHYLRAFKMFSRWLVKDRRSRDDVVAHLSMMNADTDRRRVRRPLSAEEFERLLVAARKGPPVQLVSGPDRMILYIVACYTGFRRNEIGAVMRRSFDFKSDPPTLTVRAAYTKHRRDDVLPLRGDFAAMIHEWIEKKPDVTGDEPLLQIRGKRTAEMLKGDLERARTTWIKEAKEPVEKARREASSFLKYVDESGGFADFHALRKTFITNLSRAGVSPKTAQALARHCDINLTMNAYTMLSVHDHASAVESLPPIPKATDESPPQEAAATGTDGPVSTASEVPTVVPRGAKMGAKRLAADALQAAPICTDGAIDTRRDAAPTTRTNSEENSHSCASACNSASRCDNGRGGTRTRTPLARYGILSPVRLPIPPLGQKEQWPW